ncbi:MAG: ferrochelatase [Thermodesulfobacteriota bacterium]|jgi:ferrochelatase|nr:MAG: ferrochelatase [Thermodesulfobacteriota bacterium]
MEKPYQHTGILLLAFGGPSSLEDVEPFLKNVFSGRSLNPFVVNQVKKRYQLIGGKSPLPEITEQQAQLLQNNLKKRGMICDVSIGMRYWQPFISEAINTLHAKGIKKILCIILSPFSNVAATGGYNEAVYQTIRRFHQTMEAHFVSPWNTHARYLDAAADRIKAGLNLFSANIRTSVPIVFSAHSLPLERVSDGLYVNEIKKTIAGVITRLENHEWYLVFQSQGKEGAWLAPHGEDVLKNIAASGKKDVLVVPLGFVSDHLETLYDLDIVLRKKALDLGLNFQRAPSLNDSPQFIEALTEVIVTSLSSGT